MEASFFHNIILVIRKTDLYCVVPGIYCFLCLIFSIGRQRFLKLLIGFLPGKEKVQSELGNSLGKIVIMHVEL